MKLKLKRPKRRKLNESARVLRISLNELGDEQLINTEKGEKQFAVNERIYFLKNDRQLNVKNGSLGTILNIKDNVLTVKVDQENVAQPHIIQFSTDQYNYLDYSV